MLGALNTLIYYLGQRLGTSGAYAKTVAKITEFFSPELVRSTFMTQLAGCDFWMEDASSVLRVDWQWMVVLGIFIGAFIARKVTKESPAPIIPESWRAHFGSRPRLRYLQGFIGGMLLLLGTRVAGGCTSGHFISGTSRLAVSGMAFGLAAFATGIPTALFIYRKRRDQ
jgi:uncharacterized membrane protein YedE/YeeE